MNQKVCHNMLETKKNFLEGSRTIAPEENCPQPKP